MWAPVQVLAISLVIQLTDTTLGKAAEADSSAWGSVGGQDGAIWDAGFVSLNVCVSLCVSFCLSSKFILKTRNKQSIKQHNTARPLQVLLCDWSGGHGPRIAQSATMGRGHVLQAQQDGFKLR